MSKLTPWFSGSVKPSRDGVYERDHISWGLCYSRFYNGSWRFPAATPEQAAEQSSDSGRQREPWRGLAAKPIAKATGASEQQEKP